MLVLVVVVVMLVAFVVIVMVVVVMLMLVVVVVVIVVVVMVAAGFVLVVAFGVGLVEFGDPARAFVNFFKVKLVCSQNLRKVNGALCRFDNLCVGLKLLYDGADFFQLFLVDQIDFVYDQRVAELDLLDQEGFDVLFFHVLFEESVSFVKLGGKAHRVDDAHQVVDVAAIDLLDGRRDRHRFANAARFNQNVVKFSGLD